MEKVTIQIAYRRDFEDEYKAVTATGYLCDIGEYKGHTFCVHRNVDDPRGTWRVTHIESGMGVSAQHSRCNTMHNAVALTRLKMKNRNQKTLKKLLESSAREFIKIKQQMWEDAQKASEAL